MIKVNLGCGYLGIDGWENFDNSIVAKFAKYPGLIKLAVKLHFLPPEYLKIKWPRIEIMDCRKRSPFCNESVDYIYTSHFLEHLYKHEALGVLKECYRVLRPGGLIRIAVPDVELLVKAYLEDRRVVSENVADPKLAFTRADLLCSMFQVYESNRITPPGLILRIQQLFLRYHKWLYDEQSMGALMKAAGFKPYKSAFKQSKMPDVEKLDVGPEFSLYMEAIK